MSRSYRKNLIITDGQKKTGGRTNRRKRSKRAANKQVRRQDDEIADGKAYRKEYSPYDICDYKFRYVEDYSDYFMAEYKWKYK